MLAGLLTIYTIVLAFVTQVIDAVKPVIAWPLQKIGIIGVTKPPPTTSTNLPPVTSVTPGTSTIPVIDTNTISKCVDLADKLTKAQYGFASLNTSGQYQVAKRDICPIYTEMGDCAIDSDPFYQLWCKDPDCVNARAVQDAAIDDFNWQVSQGLDPNGQFQVATSKLCPAFDDIIKRCTTKPTNPLYDVWCADPACVASRHAVGEAVKDFTYQVSQGLDLNGQYQVATAKLCPAYDDIVKNCTTDVSSESLYKTWCANPTCVTNRNKLQQSLKDFNWQTSQGLTQDGQYQVLLRDVCPAFEAAITGCGDDTIKTDPIYSQYCADVDCTRARQTRDAAVTDFTYQVSQGLDLNGQYQVATAKLCPAFEDISSICGEDITTDPLYKTWCANPTCVTNRHNLNQTLKDYNWSVSQGINQDGQYQLLLRDVCPDYQAAIASCPDDHFESDALYSQYCADVDCTRAQQARDAALTSFRYQVSQGLNDDGKYQVAVRDLCPTYDAVKTACGETSTDPEYLAYCAQPLCAADLHVLNMARASYDYQVSQGLNQDGQYQVLVRDVCPPYQTMKTDCIAKLPTDPLYHNYCDNIDCTNARRTLDAAKADLQWQTSQGLTQSGQAQLIFAKVCPAMKDVLQKCTDANIISSIENDPLYINWCKYQDCAQNRQAITNAEADLQWSISQGLTQDGIYQVVPRDICPKMALAIATCPADQVTQIKADHLYTDYCQYPACTDARRAAAQQDANLTYSLGHGLNSSGKNQTLNNYVCPALSTMQSSCPTDHWYQSQYQADCNNLKCVNQVQKLTDAIGSYNYQAPQINAYGRAQLLSNQVCPLYWQLPDCTDAQVAAQKSGAIWNACQYAPQCPVDQYQMDTALATMRSRGPLVNYGSNNATYVANYCNAAAKVASDPSSCGVTMPQEYQDFCVNSSCANSIMGLNQFILNNNPYWGGYSEASRKYIAGYACGNIQSVRNTCSTDQINSYVTTSTIPNVPWYMQQCQ